MASTSWELGDGEKEKEGRHDRDCWPNSFRLLFHLPSIFFSRLSLVCSFCFSLRPAGLPVRLVVVVAAAA
jgi:hypothetical protein